MRVRIALVALCACSTSTPTPPDGTVLVDDEDVTALAIDATYLYWTTPDGRVMRLRRDRTDVPLVLVSGLPSPPLSIAVDSTSVYWTTSGNKAFDGAVMRVGINGGAPDVLASGLGFPHAIALSGSVVYWAESTGICSLSLTGGSIVPVVAGDGGIVEIDDIALDSTNIYWLRDRLFSQPLAGGTKIDISGGMGGVGKLALDGARAYRTATPEPCDTPACSHDNTATVMMGPLSGGAAVQLAQFTLPSHQLATQIAVDTQSVYWTTDHDLQRTGLDGGDVETLASNEGAPRAMVLGASDIYWACGPIGNYPAAIRTIAK